MASYCRSCGQPLMLLRPGRDQCARCEAVDVPRARNTDPETSHLAAESVQRLPQTQQRILEILRSSGPLDDEEIAIAWQSAWGPMSPSGLRSRRAELVAKGLVRATGHRSTTQTGRPCEVWAAT